MPEYFSLASLRKGTEKTSVAKTGKRGESNSWVTVRRLTPWTLPGRTGSLGTGLMEDPGTPQLSPLIINPHFISHTDTLNL